MISSCAIATLAANQDFVDLLAKVVELGTRTDAALLPPLRGPDHTAEVNLLVRYAPRIMFGEIKYAPAAFALRMNAKLRKKMQELNYLVLFLFRFGLWQRK